LFVHMPLLLFHGSTCNFFRPCFHAAMFVATSPEPKSTRFDDQIVLTIWL
jgi:hypothetical protein